MLRHRLAALAFATVLCACRPEADPSPATPPTPLGISPWQVPGGPGSASPSLSVSSAGQLLLLWYDQQPGRRTLLQFNAYSPASAEWDVDRTVAVGSAFVVDRHDIPHLIADAGGVLWVQWLQKTGEDGSAYDVVVSQSRDGGQRWSPPVRPHDDRKRAAHGFPALWTQADGLGVAWLDGRDTVDDAGRAAGGAMQLRAATYDIALQRSSDAVLDATTSECGSVAVAMTDAGPVLAYRDVSGDNVRDIAVVRRLGAAWSTPARVHADGWKTTACPVNGPAIAAHGNAVSVGWTTESGGAPVLRLSESRDGGARFAAPVSIDAGKGLLAPVQVARDASGTWVVWLREEAGSAVLWLARVRPGAAAAIDRTRVAELPDGAGAIGRPQLAVHQGTAYVLWTAPGEDGPPRLQGARYRPME